MTERALPSTKQNELIEIASRLFYKQGYGTTGIKQIIEEAGIAKGTFYTHFTSKEELGLAWLRDRHQKWNSWLAAEIDQLETPGKKIIGTFGFLATWMKEADYRGCAFINTCAETPDCNSPLRKEVESHKRDLHEMFQQLSLQHCGFTDLSATSKKADAARHAGTVFYLLFEGSLLEAQIFGELWPIQAAQTKAEAMISSPL